MLIRTPTDLAALIRERRRQLGWDQQSLADRIGVSRQWVIEIEKGKARAEVGLVLRALDALGVSLSPGAGPVKTDPGKASDVDLDAIIRKAREEG